MNIELRNSPLFLFLVAVFVSLFRSAPSDTKPAGGAGRPRRSESDVQLAAALASERKWRAMLRELADFKAAHGHCEVPGGVSGYCSLRAWLYVQQVARNRGELRASRLSALSALGVKWSPTLGRSKVFEATWNGRLAELADFKRSHGHANVPCSQARTVSLYHWACTQKRLIRSGALKGRRRDRLEALIGE